MPFFHSTFTKTLGSTGKYTYTFNTSYKESPETYNKKHPFSVDGDIIHPSDTHSDTEGCLINLPEETSNPAVLKGVFTQWLLDCSGAFVTPPTIEKCLANVSCELDGYGKMVSLLTDEEEKDWVIQWVPTKIKVEPPKFTIFWAPSYKVEYLRPTNEQIQFDEPGEAVEVQSPEKTYTILPLATRLVNGEWMQELTDVSLPLSDSPALRLDVDLEMQKEKMRRRIRDARIRAKLARYRAERIASRYETKFGEYPSEDDEEAQTEAETDVDE